MTSSNDGLEKLPNKFTCVKEQFSTELILMYCFNDAFWLEFHIRAMWGVNFNVVVLLRFGAVHEWPFLPLLVNLIRSRTPCWRMAIRRCDGKIRLCPGSKQGSGTVVACRNSCGSNTSSGSLIRNSQSRQNQCISSTVVWTGIFLASQISYHPILNSSIVSHV